MAFRGGGMGRSRGRGGGGGRDRGRGWGRGSSLDARHGKAEEYVIFPEIANLPPAPKVPNSDVPVYFTKHRLESYWKGSCYHLGDSFSKPVKDDKSVERYSDSLRKDNRFRRENITSYMKLTSSNFPSELIQGMQGLQRPLKKLRWDRDADKKLDLLEKLDVKSKDADQDEKEKKIDSDNEVENNETEEEEDGEGDYEQNIDFDDDEDDMNMDDGPDEDFYED